MTVVFAVNTHVFLIHPLFAEEVELRERVLTDSVWHGKDHHLMDSHAPILELLAEEEEEEEAVEVEAEVVLAEAAEAVVR